MGERSGRSLVLRGGEGLAGAFDFVERECEEVSIKPARTSEAYSVVRNELLVSVGSTAMRENSIKRLLPASTSARTSSWNCSSHGIDWCAPAPPNARRREPMHSPL